MRVVFTVLNHRRLLLIQLALVLLIAPAASVRMARAAEPFLLVDAPTSQEIDQARASVKEETGPADSEAELAKKTLNPVADLISVPFQYNADYNIGPKDATRQILNIQPVVPVMLNQDWNLIVRTILPVVDIDSVAPGVDSMSGIGDITQSFFLSPKQPVDGWILGAGPVFLWPSGTDGLSGRKWGAGPTAVALRQEHGWTYGALVNHIWSYTGDENTADINATFLQPFLSYTFKTYTSITLNTESTYDWVDDQWTVPINLDVSQILKIGKLPVSIQAGPRYYAEGPSGGPDWGWRFNFTFLFPK
jgi:hypothetical protein